ncbi:hypothetical protein [Streptomyces sp. CA-111067]|uniref:hypothetical protein n=1 Tax=Streptomyces sp. CA-111067 TaxID=3240046 RepID=UPI003D978516
MSAGTARFVCPHGCGWHYDEPALSDVDLAGIVPDPQATTMQGIVISETRRALLWRAQATEQQLGEHLLAHLNERKD